MMDLSAVGIAIDLLKRPAKRRRFTSAGFAANGAYDEAAGLAETDIDAVIQPFAADSTAENKMDLRSVPEGERVEDYVIVWTKADIRASNETTGVAADEIDALDGRVFKIVSLTTRVEGGFKRAIAGLIHDRGRSL